MQVGFKEKNANQYFKLLGMHRIIVTLFYFVFFMLACDTNEHSAPQSADTTIQNEKKPSLPDTIQKIERVPDSSYWKFDKINGSKLLFGNGKQFETHLCQLKYIGEIPVEKKAPFFIFSGSYCNEFDTSTNIYIHSPDDGTLNVETGKNRYPFPGKEKDFSKKILLLQSRAFYGEVLNNVKGIIWYEKRLLSNRKWDSDIFLINVSNGTKKDTLFKDNGHFLEQTINLLKNSKCLEIEGREFISNL